MTRPRLLAGAYGTTAGALPGGTVLDMFGGSGPVAEACIIEGFRCVIIEKERKSADLIRKRLSKSIQPVMFGGEIA